MKEKSLTDSVARLHRAGDEHSKSTEKLRKATDGLLRWLKDNVPVGFQLPNDCTMYPSGEFEAGFGKGALLKFKLTLGRTHSRHDLLKFSELIASGWLDRLSEALENEAAKLNAVASAAQTSAFWSKIRAKGPYLRKFEVKKLLELIAGGEKPLTVAQLREWRDLILFNVEYMRSCYEKQPKDYPVREYYVPCWAEIEAADSDQKLIDALDGLRTSIQWQ